jgi:acyl-coenzyme A synthetase/AMP-(fatty) acid ligase
MSCASWRLNRWRDSNNRAGICFVTELPYTATGKIQRFKLRREIRSMKSV